MTTTKTQHSGYIFSKGSLALGIALSVHLSVHPSIRRSIHPYFIRNFWQNHLHGSARAYLFLTLLFCIYISVQDLFIIHFLEIYCMYIQIFAHTIQTEIEGLRECSGILRNLEEKEILLGSQGVTELVYLSDIL